MSNIAPTMIEFKDFPGKPRADAPTWVRMAFPMGTTQDEVVQVARSMVYSGQVMAARVFRYDQVDALHEFGWQRYAK